MKKAGSILITCILTLIIIAPLFGQDDAITRGLNAITEQVVKGQHNFLASDWTEGRATGEKGGFMAADYIASIFQIYELEPAGDDAWTQPTREQRWNGVEAKKYRTFFQDFSLIKYSAGDNHKFSLIAKEGDSEQVLNFDFKTDFTVRYSDVSKSVKGDIVFVGYGLVDEDNNYDDYKGIDVKGKIILRLSGYPGHNDTASEAYKKFHPSGRWASYYLERDKNTATMEKGAIAVIQYDSDDDLSSSWATNYPFRYNTPYYEGDKKLPSIQDYNLKLPGDLLRDELVRIHLSKRGVNEILSGSGINIDQYEEKAQKNMKSGSKALEGRTAFAKINVNSEIIKARNVIGVIEGKDTENCIVVGAHYDHYGISNGYIWNGADDNASGTVGMMTLAKAIMATGEKPEKTIVFAAWTGEEKGLLGSRYFVENPYLPLENILLNINYDMISRDDTKDTLGIQVGMTYFEPLSQVEEISRDNLEKYDIGLDVNYRASTSSRGGSDHAPFAAKDVPYIFWMAGFHTDYHTPVDEINKTNYKKMTDIIRLGFLDLWEFANSTGVLKSD